MTTRAGDAAWSARDIEHTADVGFEVDAPSWPVLLERAALVVAAMIVALDGVAARETVRLEVAADDREELLHDWLQAVLIRVQGGFVPCEVTVDEASDTRVAATLRGEPLDPQRHRMHGEVKGVTWHGLALEETPTGLRARVIVDV
ncbi:MAG: archease [Candidatus Rokuibacteriota bacterium]